VKRITHITLHFLSHYENNRNLTDFASGHPRRFLSTVVKLCLTYHILVLLRHPSPHRTFFPLFYKAEPGQPQTFTISGDIV